MAYVGWFVARARGQIQPCPGASGVLATDVIWKPGDGAPEQQVLRRGSQGDHGRRGPVAGGPTPAPTKRTEKEINRTDGPAASTTTLRTHRPAAGAASVAEVAGAVAETRRGEEDGARRPRRLVVAEGRRQAPAAVVVLWCGRPRRHSRRWDRLRLDHPRAAATDFDLGTLSFSVALPLPAASGRAKLPCSTTPAADESGRPAPRSTRGKITSDTQQRWLAGGRQFALSDDEGKLHVLSPAVKEQLHHMPAG